MEQSTTYTDIVTKLDNRHSTELEYSAKQTENQHTLLASERVRPL